MAEPLKNGKIRKSVDLTSVEFEKIRYNAFQKKITPKEYLEGIIQKSLKTK